MKHILTTLVAVATLSTSQVQAESLLQVYKLAKAHDPSLRSAAATYNAEKESVTITKGNLFPQVTFNSNLGYSKTDANNTTTDTTPGSVALNMNYPIYSPALGYAVDAVTLNFQSAEVALENAEEDLALTSLTEYFNLLIAQATFKTTQSQVISTASQLDRVKKQFDVGLVSVTDLQDAQAAYDAVKVSELTAQSKVINAQQALFQRTGQKIVNIPELSKDYQITLDDQTSVEQLIKLAYQHNTDIRKLDLAVLSAETNIQIQKSNGRSPTVTLTGALTHSDQDLSSGNNESNVASINVGVTIPLYRGGAIDASVRQASSSSEATIEQREAALQSLELNIRSLYLDLQTTVAQVKAQSQLIRSRTSALEATQAGYDVGIRNVVELLNAQSNLFDAQNAYQQLRYGFVVKRLNMLELTGQLTEDAITQLDSWLNG